MIFRSVHPGAPLPRVLFPVPRLAVRVVLIGAQTAALLLGGISVMRRLPAWMRYRCVATPGFAREHFAGGLTLPDVLEATAILFDRKDALHDVFFGLRLGAAVGRYPRHYFPSPTALLNAILD
ncbi:hypothetical protein SAMN05192563_1001479 [Paraburkholderia aspalathi]|uniref:Uncharacterized protein n=1 Tax=Paraburkholderia aspalathi TaxID=1324617 RepID=A0A1I6YGC9_9BURK|nr:hypothetical protein SAMN05192563_1001479 [Paraburkholderia aspalathi]